MHPGVSIWLDVILAWKNIGEVPEVRSQIDTIGTGNIDEIEETKTYYRRLLRSHEAMIICLPLAEDHEQAAVPLARIAEMVADDPRNEESVARARKRIKSTESRRNKGEKPKVIDVLEAVGILEVRRPQRNGQTYTIRITQMGLKAVETIVPNDKLRTSRATYGEAEECGEHTR